VNDWVSERIIELCSSEYVSPVVIVKKKKRFFPSMPSISITGN